MSKLDKIMDLCEEYNLELYEDYSGRGMYGTECIGVEGDTYDIQGATGALRKILGNNRQDSMGLGSIIYWPSVSMESLKEEGEYGTN